MFIVPSGFGGLRNGKCGGGWLSFCMTVYSFAFMLFKKCVKCNAYMTIIK